MSHIHWVEKGVSVCPTTGELWVVQPPFHPRPTDNCDKFFELCFQSESTPGP
jgi:hypothetical protein